MIEEITIKDLGVIGAATLPLGPGFTAVTGETGAGKTMVVTALGLLLGSRADAGAVRSGSSQAAVEGRWRLDAGTKDPIAERVSAAGGDVDDDELILVRTVSSEGRSRAVVGGRQAPIAVLTELGDELVVVHGQSEQLRLRSSSAQRELLDAYAGPDCAAALTAYTASYAQWQQIDEQLTLLTRERGLRATEAERLRSELAEIEAVEPVDGEDVVLAERADRLTNVETLREGATAARELLSSEDVAATSDILSLVGQARRELEAAGAHDVTLATLGGQLSEAGFLLTDIASELSSYLAGLDGDAAGELQAMQERRADLSVLMRKYGPELSDVLAYYEQASLRLLELDNDDTRIESLAEDLVQARERLEADADTLSRLRSSAADTLAVEVTEELHALAMPDATLTVQVDSSGEPGPHGQDAVALLLRPHSGAEPRPVGKGASGGELSRVMLAIEVVIAGGAQVPTYVFDEVDAGVGGAAAIEIGRRLARLAERAQVIVVTHLAQVAAFAGNHLSVVKDSEGQVTESSVQQLTGPQREAEMARLLSGLPDSENALAHARELLEMAGARR